MKMVTKSPSPASGRGTLSRRIRGGRLNDARHGGDSPVSGMTTLWLILPSAFLVGAMPFGYWLGKAPGIDVRQTGSGNIGATNVSRSLGWQSGIAVLVLDTLKVAGPTALTGWATGSPAAAALVAGSGMLGHVFSPFVGFKGGKGVACLLGASLILNPVAAGLCLAAFILTVALTRLVSLGSLVAAIMLPVVLAYLKAPQAVVSFGLFAVILVGYTHWANIVRLCKGEEPRLGKAPSTERS